MFELQWAARGTSLCEWQMDGCADCGVSVGTIREGAEWNFLSSGLLTPR